MTTQEKNTDVHTYVRQHYGKIAAQAGAQKRSSCCGEAPADVIDISQVAKMYSDPNAVRLPTEVTDLSLGCGDPVTLASLQPGETVLDLGSGGGIDCFLAAKRVGASGQVIGVDMTSEMLEKARANKERLKADNVEFRLGEIEHLPVADGAVDVIISNCVINLSPDKPQVFREAYRVLKPGGRFSVSDVVTDGPLPEEVKKSLAAWGGCVAGALDVSEYLTALEEAGFTEIELSPQYWDDATIEAQAEQLNLSECYSTGALTKAVFSAKITAYKAEG